MLVRLILAFAIAVLGLSSACAGVVAQPNAPSNRSGWAEFDLLAAEAKQAAMADPNLGLAKARELVELAQSQPTTRDQQEYLGTGFRLEAESLTRMNRLAEAHATLGQALKIVSQSHRFTPLDGDVALSTARIARAEGDFARALKS